SAGHCRVLFAGARGTPARAMSPEGMPLGIMPDTVFVNDMVELTSPCQVLLYTDGLTEAVNAEGERFGQDRLAKWLEQNAAAARPAAELKQELAGILSTFQAKTALNDDQTFLIMTG